jgi:hypothetical protein
MIADRRGRASRDASDAASEVTRRGKSSPTMMSPGETVRRAALTMIEAPLESRQRGLYGSLAMFAVSAPLASAWPSSSRLIRLRSRARQ